MISTTMATALNEQIKWEMYSANLYLAMSAYLQDAGLTGFSHWMRIQYQEETAHALIKKRGSRESFDETIIKKYDFIEESPSCLFLMAFLCFLNILS